MARWKLMCPHYLETRDTEWEYNETDRQTGRPKRTRFPVPRYLNPVDSGDWTNRWGSKDNEMGEIIVCHENKGEKGDITFWGNPTPDMVPIDDEAKAITATFEDAWRYKPDDVAAVEYKHTLIEKFQKDIAVAQAKPAEVSGLKELAEAVTLMARNQAAMLTAISKPSTIEEL